uniref:Reverse transcriptase domain-containing protein n=1 Tax=Leptobrachium leishanense TaxID=445787 RepID=A0A8C5MQM8_9ANUR
MPLIITSRIGSITWSDHADVSIALQPLYKGGEGRRWRLDPILLQQPGIRTRVKDSLTEYFALNETPDVSTAVLWEAHKAVTRGVLISQAAYRKKEKLKDILTLQTKLRTQELIHKAAPEEATYLLLSQTRTDLNRLFIEDAGRALLWSKQRYFERSNKIDTPLARKIKPKYKSNQIAKIVDKQGVSHDTPKEIRDAFTAYFAKLYHHTPSHNDSNRTLQADIEGYLTKSSIPHLNEQQIAALDSPFTEEEIREVVKELKPNKAPGPDGLTGQYYKCFANSLVPRLCTMFNSLRGGGGLMPEALLASVVLIPKPGKDVQGIDNYRPISLLNTDLKILAKLMALRLGPMLSTLIHPDQVGFMPGRQAFENTRRAADLIWWARSRKVPSLFLSLDAEKAFDRAEWPFLFRLLERAGLPESFLALTRALYATPMAQILIPGTDPTPFPIRNGTRQGCPLSPTLFAIFLEPLMRMIRADGDIRGFLVGGQQFKVSAYADDVLLSLTDPEISLPALMSQLTKYSQISGYKININKSMILPILVPARMLQALTREMPLQISASELPYLGIKLTGLPERLYEVNYAAMYATLKQDLECWDKYAISWVGRVNCIKMNVLPRLLYYFQTIPVALDPSDVRSMQGAIDNFVWAGRRHRVARATLYRPKQLGGLGLPSLFSYYYAAQLAQLVAWHGGVHAGRWVELERAIMAPNLPHHWIWLAREHRPLLSTNCPAIMNTIRIWDKLAARCDLATLPSPLTPIFRNREFPAGLRPLPFQQLWDVGLHRLCHLYQKDQFVPSIIIDQQESGTGGLFLPERQLRAFASRRHIKAASQTPLSFFESICLKGTYPKGLISTLYYKLTSLIDWKELHYIQAWERDLAEVLDSEDWLDIWEASKGVSLCTSMQEQPLKMLMRWYTTPTQLAHMSPNHPDLCWRSCGSKGTFIHMWWECPQIQKFWTNILTMLSDALGKDVPRDPWNLLLSRPLEGFTRHENKLISKISMAARRAVAETWRHQALPVMAKVSAKIQDTRIMDELTAVVRHTLPQFHKVWDPWTDAGL